jgi:hypothetical protein
MERITMGLKILSLDEGSTGLGLEKEDSFNNFVNSKTLFGRFKWRAIKFLVERIGFMPYMYFEREDINEAVVKKLLKHPEHLTAVLKWVEEIDHSVLPLLQEAKVLFEKIQKPKKRDSKLYRAFKIVGDQHTLGLDKKALAELHPGDTIEYTVNKPLSFSSYKEVTKAYGNVAVSVDYAKEDKRMFHITNEILIAAFMVADEATEIDQSFISERIFSYFESVFLPDGEPMTFTLLHK